MTSPAAAAADPRAIAPPQRVGCVRGWYRSTPGRSNGYARGPGHNGGAILLSITATVLLFASPLRAWQIDSAEAYRDSAALVVVQRARASREGDFGDIDSYEATLRQRLYVGLTGLRFRRERSLLEHERIARIRWTAAGDRTIQWIGIRTAVPIAGIDSDDPDGPRIEASVNDSSAILSAGGEGREDMATALLDDTEMIAFDFDPRGDRLRLGREEWALHPLSDTADAHYWFASGDTLRLSFPSGQADIVLYEILVEPRRADFKLVAGSLWFDAESGSLVRATYRPARPFDLSLDDPQGDEDVPAFLGPIRAEVDYVTIEYALQELRYWLPRRFAFQGRARIGWLATVPVTLEWSLGGYMVNESETGLHLQGPLPDGWQRKENVAIDDDGVETRVTVIVPPSEALRSSPDLSAELGQNAPTAFTEEEIGELASQLRGLLPTYRPYRPRLYLGPQRGLLRFNRVEGLSVGSVVAVPLNLDVALEATARFASAAREAEFAVALRMGTEADGWSLEGYHRLQSMADDGSPFGLAASVANLVGGGDRGEYYRATGAAAGYHLASSRIRFDLSAFRERERPVGLATTFSLRGAFTDFTPTSPRAADPVTVSGGRARLRWFSGVDPEGLVLTGLLDGEMGFGDAEYRRARASLSMGHPLVLGLSGAVEVAGGATWGEVPVQREFLIGGTATLRGFDTNGYVGEAFWRARGELGAGLVAARLIAFADAAWAGPRAAAAFHDPLLAVGVGASLLDGVIRADVAHGLRGGHRWKLHLYLDGLF